ncbi:MAG: hypothetical protein ACLQT7_05865 [Candidatus Dormibacteria bacterium]
MRKLMASVFFVAVALLGQPSAAQLLSPASPARAAVASTDPSSTPTPALTPLGEPVGIPLASTPTATPTPTPTPVPAAPTHPPATRAPATRAPAPPAPAPASSGSGTGNPAADDTALWGDILSACGWSSSGGAACEQASINALDAAMSGEGVTPTALPSGFWSLPYDQQLILLANSDRTARGLPALAGPDGTLDGYALSGAEADTDPRDPCDPCSWTANWAETINSVAAEFTWMYDDGFGSGNRDCTSAGASGCWIHREDILHAWGGPANFGGACVTTGSGGAALSCAELFEEPR